MPVATVFPDDWPAMAVLEGTAVYNATNADAETLVNVPVAATVPPNSRLIYEMVLVDDLTGTNFMRFGANLDGQTGPSWIMADACGAPTPMDLAVAFGLPNSFVMNVTGDVVLGTDDNLASQVSIFPNPATTRINIDVPANIEILSVALYDIVGKNTGAILVNGSMDVSNLSRGVYILNVKTDQGTLTQKVIKR
jgi:hypothetical protein